MKKKTKIIFSALIIIVLLISGGLLYGGNYLYNLALNPNTDKSVVFDNKDTQNKQEFEKVENTLLEDQGSDVYLENDSLKLHSYLLNQNSDTWVITVHGYTGQASDLSNIANEFYQRGYNILAPDLRGHGQSEGDYIGMGWDDRLDILAWIDYLNQNYNFPDIILYGISMGAATVMNVSGEDLTENVKFVIEDCGYTSTWDIFAYQLNSLFNLPAHPFLDVANLVTKIKAGYTFNHGPINQIQKCQIPILFIHGDQDTFVPSKMVDILYEKAACPKEKLIIEGAGHGQSKDTNPDLYWRVIDEFIRKYLN